MSPNFLALTALVSSVLMILALKGLSSPVSARRGNLFGIAGMVLAVLATLTTVSGINGILIVALAGGSIGAIIAKRIPMTRMPEMVAGIHSLVGAAAVFIALAVLMDTPASQLAERVLAQDIELILGSLIGAITLTGSIIAFGKLSARISGRPLRFRGQHALNLVLAIIMFSCGASFILTHDLLPFAAMLGISLALGILLILPIGGADMPVVVSMLNSYSGWSAAGIGFTLENDLLIVAGALVGSSGAILSHIMCRAMNRSLIHVLLGGFGGTPQDPHALATTSKTVNQGAPNDAAFLLKNALSVVIVPGYGLAVSRAQQVLRELDKKLTALGIRVRYAIHPVAGRMPGHMNVLLAEADVPYDQVFEMETINHDFPETDVALVIGANDVVNPAARTDPTSPIYGMPILDVHLARTVLIIKRSMAAGYSGIDNELFYRNNTMMVFGDAKQVLEEIVRAV